MIWQEGILGLLYSDRFIGKSDDPKIRKMTDVKMKHFRRKIKKFINDEKIIDDVMLELGNFLFDYTEVEETQKFQCYGTGFIDREKFQNELKRIAKEPTPLNTSSFAINDDVISSMYKNRKEFLTHLTGEDIRSMNKVRKQSDMEKKEKYLVERSYKIGACDATKIISGLMKKEENSNEK